LTREQTEDKTTNEYQEVTIGANLALGGSFTYLAKSGVYEGLTSNAERGFWDQYTSGTIGISTDASVFYKDPISGLQYIGGSGVGGSKPGVGVNLINNHDPGRQIQQSYYAAVGGSDTNANGANGYTRAYCYTESATGKYWPYNPVQAGDCGNNTSQIIDYELNTEKNYIYVKTRAMDWAQGIDDRLNKTLQQTNAINGGRTTKSYMENYYRLNDDGTLYVNNSFVDWNGFTDMASCDFCSVELPAFYPIQSLNHFFTYDGDYPWTNGALTCKNDLSGWTNGGNKYFQSNRDLNANGNLGEEWIAWANDASGSVAFGMYIPNVDRFTSGRSENSVKTGTSANVNADSNLLESKGLMSNMQGIGYQFQGAYVQNTSYTAPGVSFRMAAYVPIEYTYVLAVNDITTVRSQFKAIHDSGKVTNAGRKQGDKVGLDAWARDDKIWTQF
jgi:hypothetical protein